MSVLFMYWMYRYHCGNHYSAAGAGSTRKGSCVPVLSSPSSIGCINPENARYTFRFGSTSNSNLSTSSKRKADSSSTAKRHPTRSQVNHVGRVHTRILTEACTMTATESEPGWGQDSQSDQKG